MSDPGRRSLRLALVCPPISGHLNPALSLAGELQRRGHRVAWFGVPDGEARVRAAGMEPMVIAADSLPLGSVPAHMKRQGELRGLAALRWILRCLQQEALAHFRDLPQAWTAWKAEGVLVDQVSHGASSAAQGMGLPYVSLCHALPVHADTSVPPFSTTWSHRPGRWGRLRNGLGLLAVAPFLKRYLAPLNAARRRGGLGPLTLWDTGDSKRAVVSQLPLALEFPGRRSRPNFHHTGPWVRAGTRPTVTFDFHRLDGRPLVYASMGTLQNRMLPVFHTMAEACAGLDVQLVMALGAEGSELTEELPGDPIVVGLAPQLELLKRASLAITHAGLNTALEALMFGVPMVALPVANDQPGVAARLRHHGVAELIPIRHVDAPRLRNAIVHVLGDPSYRAKAQSLQKELAGFDGVRRAADIVEAQFA